MTQPGRYDVLGVGVSAVDMPGAIGTIEQWIAGAERQYVCVTTVHGVMESWRDESLRLIHERAGMVTPDGMPLVWAARLAGLAHVTRVYGPDLMLAVCERSQQTGWRHFLYGGSEASLRRLQERLTQRFPRLAIVGAWSPPFRELGDEEERAVVERINAARPDCVWVGLGTPKQERWMAGFRDRLEAPVLLGVGAAFDFHAGLKAQAPRWMQQSGLEWLFRLVTEPRRLWRRYLTNNPMFVALMVVRMLRGSLRSR